MSAKHAVSAQERERRRALDRKRLKQAAEQLLSSEGWQRWVRVRAMNGLARYSLGNQLLIAFQTEGGARFVAGFKRWLELGYCVRKGEKALRILAPVTVKERDRTTGEETGETKTFYRTVFVFDRAQVDALPSGEPAPLEPPHEPLTGDSHAHLLAPLQSVAESLGYATSFEPIDGPADGFCDSKAKRIVIDVSQPANAQLRTLIHETAHALGVDYEHYSRAQAEVVVDTVTFVVSSSVGLDVGGETIPYVAGWGEDGALEAVGQFAGTIDSIARRIEDALARDDHDAETEHPPA